MKYYRKTWYNDCPTILMKNVKYQVVRPLSDVLPA